MKELLQKVSKLAIELGDTECTEEQLLHNWIGYPPASEVEIAAVEEKLQVQLPTFYKDFLKITNGFNYPSCVSSYLLKVSEIGFFRNIEKDFLKEMELEANWNKRPPIIPIHFFKESIIIGRLEHEQYLLLLPPNKEKDSWTLWEHKLWCQEKVEDCVYHSLKDYYEKALEFIEEDLH